MLCSVLYFSGLFLSLSRAHLSIRIIIMCNVLCVLSYATNICAYARTRIRMRSVSQFCHETFDFIWARFEFLFSQSSSAIATVNVSVREQNWFASSTHNTQHTHKQREQPNWWNCVDRRPVFSSSLRTLTQAQTHIRILHAWKICRQKPAPAIQNELILPHNLVYIYFHGGTVTNKKMFYDVSCKHRNTHRHTTNDSIRGVQYYIISFDRESL